MADRSQIDPARVAAELRRGDEALARGEAVVAHAAFLAAQRLDGNDPAVLSRLGLTLVLVAHDEYKGVAFCEEAVKRGGENPDALLRLARVYHATFQKERAFRAIRRGLALDPGHEGHLELLERMGVRRRPVIPFLPRSNVLNKFLGRLRHRFSPPRG
jgi:cytochrome c-type biogenesis protein CcmH/NrfG